MSWKDDADCKGLDEDGSKNLFFEAYEQDRDTAEYLDELCLTCPVRSLCLELGVTTGGTGLFGGAYLVLGKYSTNRNSHKLPYISKKLREEIISIQEKKK